MKDGDGFIMIMLVTEHFAIYVTALKTGKMKPNSNIDDTFFVRRYSNWKDASRNKGKFASHECSSVHKTAIEIFETPPRTTRDIGEQLSSSHAEEKLQNCSYVPFKGIPSNTVSIQKKFSLTWRSK